MQAIKEVTFERTCDAPPEAVWQAWTEPARLQQWWGPNGVNIPECEVDVRVGGRFYIVMQAGNTMGEYEGTRWPMEATFSEVKQPSKLGYTAKAWTEGDETGTEIKQTAELTLSDDHGKTKMILKVVITSIGPKAGAAVTGMRLGYEQQFDKLDQFLQQS